MIDWIWTSVIMLGYIIICIIIVSKYLQKFSGYNEKAAIFSAAPGALGPLMILAEQEKTDLSQVATSHLIRLIIIITVIPFVIVINIKFFTSKYSSTVISHLIKIIVIRTDSMF